MEHFDLYTKLALIESSPDLKSFTKTTLDRLIRENKEQNQNIDDSLNRLDNNLATLTEYFENNDELLRSKSIVPLYYLFLLKEGGNQNQEKLEFLRLFHELRKVNRRDLSYDQVNQIMIEFDRLTQQGANQKKSLEKRLTMLDRFYDKYHQNQELSVETKISTAGLDLKKLSESKDI